MEPIPLPNIPPIPAVAIPHPSPDPVFFPPPIPFPNLIAMVDDPAFIEPLTVEFEFTVEKHPDAMSSMGLISRDEGIEIPNFIFSLDGQPASAEDERDAIHGHQQLINDGILRRNGCVAHHYSPHGHHVPIGIVQISNTNVGDLDVFETALENLQYYEDFESTLLEYMQKQDNVRCYRLEERIAEQEIKEQHHKKWKKTRRKRRNRRKRQSRLLRRNGQNGNGQNGGNDHRGNEPNKMEEEMEEIQLNDIDPFYGDDLKGKPGPLGSMRSLHEHGNDDHETSIGYSYLNQQHITSQMHEELAFEENRNREQQDIELVEDSPYHHSNTLDEIDALRTAEGEPPFEAVMNQDAPTMVSSQRLRHSADHMEMGNHINTNTDPAVMTETMERRLLSTTTDMEVDSTPVLMMKDDGGPISYLSSVNMMGTMAVAIAYFKYLPIWITVGMLLLTAMCVFCIYWMIRESVIKRRMKINETRITTRDGCSAPMDGRCFMHPSMNAPRNLNDTGSAVVYPDEELDAQSVIGLDDDVCTRSSDHSTV